MMTSERPLHIVFNATASKMGGARTYLQHLVEGFRRGGYPVRLTFWLPPEQVTEFSSFECETMRFLSSPVSHSGIIRRIIWEQMILPRWLKREKADVFISLGNTATFLSPCKQIVCVRNSLYFSKLYLGKVREARRWRLWVSSRLHGLLTRLSMRVSEVTLLPSVSIRDEILSSGFRDRKTFRVIPYGKPEVDENSQPPQFPLKSSQEVYLLNPSLSEFHKNTNTLFDAFSEVLKSCPRARLILLPNLPEVKKEAKERFGEKCIIYTGTNPKDMSRIYELAHIVVYPTYCESFGHPLIESMARGLPVVAADVPINRELAKDAAAFFPPFDPQAMAERICDLMADAETYTALSAAGIKRAEKFSWTKYIHALYDTARELNARTSPPKDIV